VAVARVWRQDEQVTPSTVIFDFDGTLVKTREASWRLFKRTNAEFELGVDRPEDFYALFRRNFFAALDEICSGDPARKDRVRAHFLQLLREEYSPDLVPGMADVIHRMATNCTLVLASSNTMESVRRTLERHDLACCFAHAFTGDLEPDKAASIRCFLADPGYSMRRLCEPEYTEECPAVAQRGEEVVLVTDTVGDVEEAIHCGIRAVGVVWGMHTAPELLAAGAEFVAIWPQELLTHLLEDPASALTCSVARSTRTVGLPATPVLDQARRAAATRRDQRVAAATALTSHSADRGNGNGNGCGCATCATPEPAALRNGNRAVSVAIDPMLRDAVARMVHGNGRH
jgi:phosphoglycolate phosphatase